MGAGVRCLLLPKRTLLQLEASSQKLEAVQLERNALHEMMVTRMGLEEELAHVKRELAALAEQHSALQGQYQLLVGVESDEVGAPSATVSCVTCDATAPRARAHPAAARP